MHMHVMAECKNCGEYRVFSTPIPDIVILSSMCENCGWGDLVGRYPENRCFRCEQQRLVDIERELRVALTPDGDNVRHVEQ